MALTSQCPVQSWYSRPCFVRMAGLPELWLRVGVCLAPFPLSARLHLAHLAPVTAFWNRSSQAQLGVRPQLFSLLAKFGL